MTSPHTLPQALNVLRQKLRAFSSPRAIRCAITEATMRHWQGPFHGDEAKDRAGDRAEDQALLALRRKWEGEGCPVPAPHPIKMAEVVAYIKRFGPRVFIETGTYLGDTLATVKAHVRKAYSIELGPALAARAQVTFARDAHVEILVGDSGELLPRILEKLYEPALFWLDGHYSMGETAKGELETPIRAELAAILGHAVRDHIVLIDDARLFGGGDYPPISELAGMVRDARPEWRFEVRDDIIRCYPPDLTGGPWAGSPS